MMVRTNLNLLNSAALALLLKSRISAKSHVQIWDVMKNTTLGF